MRILTKANQYASNSANSEYYIDVICSWCGKLMHQKKSDKNKPTHSICSRCFKEVAEEYQRSRKMVNPQKPK